jgi:hypothetical protein
MIPLALLRKIDQWIRDHMPVWCINCRRLIWAKDGQTTYTTTGIVATLCQTCERQLFRPWEK